MRYKQFTVDLAIKSLNEERRELTGIATASAVDRVGDVVDPLAARFANSIPLLLGHDASQPVGTATLQRPTASGIPFVAKIARIDQPGILKDRTDCAWQSVRAGLIRSVSIGFRSIGKPEPIRDGGVRFGEIEIVELSLVAIPAQPLATIDTFKGLSRSNSMKTIAMVEVTHDLELELWSCSTEGGATTKLRVALTRLGAQSLARSLLEYCGVDTPQVTRGSGGSVVICARGCELPQRHARRGVLKLSDPSVGSTKSRGTRRVKV